MACTCRLIYREWQREKEGHPESRGDRKTSLVEIFGEMLGKERCLTVNRGGFY